MQKSFKVCKVILQLFCGASDQNVYCHSANSAAERLQNQKCPRGLFHSILVGVGLDLGKYIVDGQDGMSKLKVKC